MAGLSDLKNSLDVDLGETKDKKKNPRFLQDIIDDIYNEEAK